MVTSSSSIDWQRKSSKDWIAKSAYREGGKKGGREEGRKKGGKEQGRREEGRKTA